MNKLKGVRIGDLAMNVPIIQGGMGIGISLWRLAGAVAAQGGMGVISAAQPGFLKENFAKEPLKANLEALAENIRKAKEISNGGLIGVNIMRACKNYGQYVQCCVENGADAIISGAGLPLELPELLKDTKVKFAPIVSSLRATQLIFKRWDKKFGRVSDFLVIEGPKAGGHLGFTPEEAENLTNEEFDQEVVKIVEYVNTFEEKYGHIPVFFAGGVYDRADIDHYVSLGCSGVQMATRFVATQECDAADAYKQAYIEAKKEDVMIVKSPVGLPGRAIRNSFAKERQTSRRPVEKCFGCIENCDPATTHYCITRALIEAAVGEKEDSLLFCGENVWRVDKMTTVKEIFEELNS
ncbi:NAD(P)H-dependent flavin oxidoreductase [Anaerotignum sp. MB30-C6]|uniref:NAD(P)H-dependent flavin oxidoreductase n=1 Tax=Anaerotignum sp. MB30-C6 TaxID=3070814 RepID=UPI0027DDFF1C|nr:nitronate monooxygenase [Anaerotignum sp. MB30-C6]WMI80042.1 nitronate monooxygenase [Anaerotignum sp. MB30-C6]